MAREKIGFIGLGIMGTPMAGHLLDAGYEVNAFDVRPAAVADVRSRGAKACESPAAVAAFSDIIIIMVPDSPDVEAVIAGDGGVLEGIRAGSVVIDMSTISPATGQKMSGLLGERGTRFVDAPVTGGASGARDATLSILAGGDAESYERVLPVLRVLGSNVTHMGPGGSGHAAKLANQILGIGCMIGVAEGLVFAKKMGLDLRTFVEAASKGASTSWMLERLGPAILDGDFAPGFMARHMRKDLRLAAEAAGEVHAALPMATLVGQLYEQLLAEDEGDLGHHAIVKVIERLSNQEARG